MFAFLSTFVKTFNPQFHLMCTQCLIFFCQNNYHLMKQNNVGSDRLASYSQLFLLHSNDGTGKVKNMKPADLYLYSAV